jgi:hypothetical protein
MTKGRFCLRCLSRQSALLKAEKPSHVSPLDAEAASFWKRAFLLAQPTSSNSTKLDEKSRLLKLTGRYRRIAQSTSDSEAVAMLLSVAGSYEVKAVRNPTFELIQRDSSHLTSRYCKLSSPAQAELRAFRTSMPQSRVPGFRRYRRPYYWPVEVRSAGMVARSARQAIIRQQPMREG